MDLDTSYVHPDVAAFDRYRHLKVAHLKLGPDATIHAETLSALGFDVVTYGDVNTLCAALPKHSFAVVLLETSPDVISRLIAQLRPVFRHACLIVVAEGLSRSVRVNALLMGADAWAEISVDSFELAALVTATTRHWQAPENEQPAIAPNNRDAGLPLPKPANEVVLGQWYLADQGWTLVAPCGTTLKLSGNERRLMSQFLGEPAGAMVREVKGLVPESGRLNIRRQLGVTVNRLKRKAMARAVTLPIRNVRGEGYMFLKDES